MNRFGIDRIVYKCSRVNKGVIIGLYYGIYRDEKVYSSIDCENKNECDVEETSNWQSCPAYKEYIGENH